jgi:regulator of RNase E activity RraA
MTTKERNRIPDKPAIVAEPEPAVLMEFSRLSTALVCDAIDLLKLRGGCLEMGIRPMWPGTRLVGIAVTAEFVPSAIVSDKGIQDLLGTIGRLGSQRVMVVGMSGMNMAAGIGSTTSRIAQRLGCVGAVVDGPVRDLAGIQTIGFPVFARGCVPSSVRGRMTLASLQQPITCGGVLVRPGDLIVGDESGVVTVPREKIVEVLAEARKLANTDLRWHEQLEQGINPIELFKRKFEQ